MLSLCNVLIVDDYPSDRELLIEYISMFDEFRNYKFIQASGVEEGLAMLSVKKPDQIILDYDMPPLTGIDFLLRVRHDLRYANFSSIPIHGYGGFPKDLPDEQRMAFQSMQYKHEGPELLIEKIKEYEQKMHSRMNEESLACESQEVQ